MSKEQAPIELPPAWLMKLLGGESYTCELVPDGITIQSEKGERYVIQYQLPEPDENTPNEVVISEFAGLSQPKSEIQASLTEVLDENSPLIVPERLTSPHPVIKNWLDEYKQSKAEEKARSFWCPF